jgi:amino acid adenylation domain-containing protein
VRVGTPSSLGRLVIAAAERTPDSPAIRDEGGTITWAQTANHVGRFAAALVNVGVRPGDRVGVHYRKSAEAFYAMHAVVQMGAIAVPLDPGASADYLSAVVAETDCTVVLTHETCATSAQALALSARVRAVIGIDLPEKFGTEGLAPDDFGTTTFIAQTEIDSLEPATPHHTDTGDAAYIITTSGSTGRPKGICHTHGSALAYVRFKLAGYDFNAADRFADIAPNHFDLSTQALWLTPFIGATNVVVREPYQMLPASLAGLAAAERISVWYSVPYLLAQLLTRGNLDAHDLSHLRWVLFAGEAVAPKMLASLMSKIPSARFSNAYGPAEVNVCTIFHLPGPPTADALIPIGRPVADTEVRLCNVEHPNLNEPVADGEVWVAGATMMAGYWQRPELTDAAITCDDAGRRWYRTGDLAHRNADDELVFTGRRDHQVKVRGYRIELEAIETALEDDPAIDHAVAAVARRADGHDVLIAGVVPNEAMPLIQTEVLRRVAERLPGYAIPVSLYPLSLPLPVTGGGKIDRRTLRLHIEHLAGKPHD